MDHYDGPFNGCRDQKKAGAILLPISMILQSVHAVLMLFETKKPEKPKQKKQEEPDEFNKRLKKHGELLSTYRKKFMYENVIAIVVILMNIIISYSVVEQIKSYNNSCNSNEKT